VEIRPLHTPVVPKGDRGEPDLRPDIDRNAGFVPHIWNSTHEVAWLGMEGTVLQPKQEALNRCVVNRLWSQVPEAAPIGEGRQSIGEPLVLRHRLHQWGPCGMPPGAAPTQVVYGTGQLKGSPKSAAHGAPGFGADAVSGRTNAGNCRS